MNVVRHCQNTKHCIINCSCSLCTPLLLLLHLLLLLILSPLWTLSSNKTFLRFRRPLVIACLLLPHLYLCRSRDSNHPFGCESECFLLKKKASFLWEWDVNTMLIPQPEGLKVLLFFCELILDLSGLEDPAISYATTNVDLQIRYVIFFFLLAR